MKNIKNVGAILGVVILLGLVLTGCKNDKQPDSQELANPASVFCEENGGKSETVTDRDGGEFGICTFENGVSCDEWEYYRGECSPTSVNQENEVQEMANSEEMNSNEVELQEIEDDSVLSDISSDEDR